MIRLKNILEGVLGRLPSHDSKFQQQVDELALKPEYNLLHKYAPLTFGLFGKYSDVGGNRYDLDADKLYRLLRSVAQSTFNKMNTKPPKMFYYFIELNDLAITYYSFVDPERMQYKTPMWFLTQAASTTMDHEIPDYNTLSDSAKAFLDVAKHELKRNTPQLQTISEEFLRQITKQAIPDTYNEFMQERNTYFQQLRKYKKQHKTIVAPPFRNKMWKLKAQQG